MITVTSPLLPDLDEFHKMLQQIWDSKWITNNGSFHRQLEEALAEYLGVPYISLFTNGTLPLITALQALRITGEVITTPYSFVATTHSLWWNGIRPVFVDIDPTSGNIDPDKIEAAITPKTTAIMPVHVYGRPCDTERIQAIADKYGLRVIYDAAHAFGVWVGAPDIAAPPCPPLKGGVQVQNYGNSKGHVLKSADRAYYEDLKNRAEYHRNNPTNAERRIWELLNNNRFEGLHFRRQHIIGQYIVNFVCLKYGLVIEIDGGYHNSPDQIVDDETRTKVLEGEGYHVIRFTNEEVLQKPLHVIEQIRNALNALSASVSPANLAAAINSSASVAPPFRGGMGGAQVSLLSFGDMSTLSFHATKVYNTIEGGALIVKDAATKQRIDYLKNFGFAGETEIVAPGINSKMDEVRAAYGLLNLRQVDEAIEARHQVAIAYREGLKDVPGITCFYDIPGVRHNYSYFPIFVDAEKYGQTRDELYFRLRDAGILGRRYFYPLISTFSTYRGLPSAHPDNLPNAHRMADTVICLPMHHALTASNSARIINEIRKNH